MRCFDSNNFFFNSADKIRGRHTTNTVQYRVSVCPEILQKVYSNRKGLHAHDIITQSLVTATQENPIFIKLLDANLNVVMWFMNYT